MIDRYQAHVDSWAKELQCEIRPCELMKAMMHVELGFVECPQIIDQRTYLCNLHELSHFFHGHTQARPPQQDKRFYFDNGVLKSEAQAWDKTLDVCIDDITDDNRKFMWDLCLGSYYWHYLHWKDRPTRLDGPGNRAWVEFTYDHPDAYFEKVMKRICKDIPMKHQYIGRWDHKSVS